MSIYHSPQNSGHGQPTSSDGLPLIQKCLQSRGISQTTQNTILSSWWTATQKHNQVYLEKWQSCADGKAVNPLNPPVRDVMEFLQEFYARGLVYLTVLVTLFSLLLWKHIARSPHCQASFCSVKLLLPFVRLSMPAIHFTYWFCTINCVLTSWVTTSI